MTFTRCDRCYKEMPVGMELNAIWFYVKQPKQGRPKRIEVEVCAPCFKKIRDFAEGMPVKADKK